MSDTHRKHRPYGRRPPRRYCRECGAAVYAWTESPLCALCVRAITPRQQNESLREFRKRVIDPDRNSAA